jgi:hypothetical protein
MFKSKGLALLFLALLAGCKKPPVIHGVVRDIFGHPLEGVTVMMEGSMDRQSTAADGTFSFPLQKANMRFLAGKKGYIKAMTTVAPPADDKTEAPPVELSLYPDPPEKGFFAVGSDGYTKLEPRQIYVRGTELRGVAGIKETSDKSLPADQPLRFVFSSTLRPSQIAQLDLRLHHLDFVESIEVPGVLGKEPVTANLWVANGPVQFDLEQLATEDDYLITTREPIKAGAYAFHTEGVLTSRDVRILETLPRELQVAYAFETR